MKRIKGFGGGGKGGGGGGRVAQEAPDTLRSIAYANVLDLVCEGEIEGLADGMRSVYFNETPLQNENGSVNFSGASIFAVNGSQAQGHIPGFSAVENELLVATEVTADTPVVRQITNDDVDAVRVRVSLPQLTQQDTTNGDLNGAKVQFAIDIQSNGGGFVPQILGASWTGGVEVTSTTTARTTAPAYQMYINLKNTSGAVYEVQYKKQSDAVWLTDGLLSGKNLVPGKNIQGGKIGAALEIGFAGDITWVMPVRDLALWEMRVVVTSGTPQITTPFVGLVYNGGNVGSPFATIDGKTTSKYERSYRIELTGDAPWDVRVRRITADSTSVALQNKTFFESYTEIIDGKFRYPNSAIIGIRIDSSQFNSIPRRSYDIKMLRVKVPNNYDPVTRTYTGIFDGTFKVAWTDNPAWCFYDLLTNERYGLGGFIPEAQVDKYTLYAIGRYCDELVPDGQGGTEPRFTCNIYFQTREEAFNVINNMASIFRGMPYWSAGSITLGYDAPSDPVYQFTNANVIDGTFNYSGSGLKARHTVALVTWNDPEDFYRQKVEYVEDAAGIERFGIVQTEIVAVGCSSRGQANRVGRWILFTEQSETELVTFKTGIEGYTIRPSQIIQVADEMRAGTRRGGRVASATTTVVTLDADVSGFTGVVGGSLSLLLPDGSLETKTISAVSTTQVTVSSAFSATPANNTVWMIQTSTIESQLFKIISAVEQEDGVEITALAHNPGKYALVEQNLKLQPRQISLLSIIPGAPDNLQISENLYEQGADVLVQVNLSWSPSDGATGYQVSYKVNERNFVNLPVTSATSIELRDAIEGIYIFKVFALNPLGQRSLPTEVTAEVYGKTLPPADVTNFSMNIIGSEAHFTWAPVGDLDLSHYKIRHSRLTSGATYAEAVDLILRIARPGVTAVAPAMTGTYFIKAVDKVNNASVNAAEIVAIIEDIKGLNVVETVTESPTFPGDKVECHVVDGTLVLDTAADFDDLSGLFDDASGDFDGGGGTVSTVGTYDFSQIVDLGAVYTSRVTAFVEVGRVDYVNTFDSAEGLFDSRDGEFDGSPNAFDDTNVELQVSVTEDDPAGTPTWSAYRKFFVGDYKARGLRFRAILTSRDAQASPSISFLEVEVDMPDRVTSGDDITSGTDAGGKVVNFAPAFKVAPALGIAAQNLTSGDYYEIVSKTASGFTIRFKNSGGTVVDRTFDYTAVGYGELAA
jgi:predicted phage tail protein